MNDQNRRAFLVSAAALGAASLASGQTAKQPLQLQLPKLVHHVFFWLKNPDSQADLDQLLAGLNSLRQIETVRGVHIGVPASTEKREVVDNSFHASEILYFDDVAGQDIYQTHPIHLAFVENNSHLWEKVIVYDAISV